MGYRNRSYSRDPYQTAARFNSVCAGCGYVFWVYYSRDDRGWYVEITDQKGKTKFTTDVFKTEEAAVAAAKRLIK